MRTYSLVPPISAVMSATSGTLPRIFRVAFSPDLAGGKGRGNPPGAGQALAMGSVRVGFEFADGGLQVL